MRYRLLFLVKILVLIAVGCSPNKPSSEYDLLMNSFSERELASLTDYKAMIFIPPSGCNECINEAENLLKQEYVKDSSDYFFIVTGYSFSKTAKIRLGEKIIQKDFILLDTVSEFSQEPFIKSGKPQAFVLKAGKVAREGTIYFKDNKYFIN